METGKNNLLVYPNMIGPFDDAFRNAVDGNKVIMPRFIAILLLSCCPPAICWFIASISIWEPVDGMYWRWTFAHVRKKVFKRTEPSFANCDASATIVVIAVIVGVCAASYHSRPYSIGKTLAGLSTMSVLNAGCLTPFSSKASARLSVPAPEFFTNGIRNGSAVTNALPSCFPICAILDPRMHGKSSEFLTGDIGDWHVNNCTGAEDIFQLETS